MAIAARPTASEPVRAPQRQRRGLSPDTTALLVGIAVSALFTGAIAATGKRLETRDIKTNDIYKWQLREPSKVGTATAWGFYMAHQIFQWSLIYYAQTRVKKYSRGLHPINYIAFGGNALFIVLHWIHSHIWYDKIASQVSVWSSQSSVVAMLVMILAIENPRRGMVAGWKAPIPQQIVTFMRKYHGYYISWATTYTFWYHPAATNRGHLSGFFYMFSLLLQGSLLYTRAHLNKWWTLSLELMVLPHGVLVASMLTPGSWRRFGFGFGWMFILTQLHGLGLALPARVGLTVAGLAGTAAFYWNKPRKYLNEPLGIPIIEFATAGLLTGFVWLGQRLRRETDAPLPLPTSPLETDEVAA